MYLVKALVLEILYDDHFRFYHYIGHYLSEHQKGLKHLVYRVYNFVWLFTYQKNSVFHNMQEYCCFVFIVADNSKEMRCG